MWIVVLEMKDARPMIQITLKTEALKEEILMTGGNQPREEAGVFESALGRVSVRIRSHLKNVFWPRRACLGVVTLLA
jgi:hypothetical protein